MMKIGNKNIVYITLIFVIPIIFFYRFDIYKQIFNKFFNSRQSKIIFISYVELFNHFYKIYKFLYRGIIYSKNY